MKINSDFRDLLRSFNAAGVRYLIVGGYAVMAHTEPRYTKDLDLWIEPSADNAARMIDALREFGAPTSDIRAADFVEPEVFFQIGSVLSDRYRSGTRRYHDIRYRLGFRGGLGAKTQRGFRRDNRSRARP